MRLGRWLLPLPALVTVLLLSLLLVGALPVDQQHPAPEAELTGTDADGATDASTIAASLNQRALELVRAASPSAASMSVLAEAAQLLAQAARAESRTLRQARRELRTQIRLEQRVRDDDADADNDEEEDAEMDLKETETVVSLRTRVRAAKSRLAEYLSNAGNVAIQRSHRKSARRLLRRALRLVPGHVDARRHLDRLRVVTDADAEEDGSDARTPRSRRRRRSRKRSLEVDTDEDEDEEEVDEESEVASLPPQVPVKPPPAATVNANAASPTHSPPVASTPTGTSPADASTPRKRRKSALDRPRRPNTSPREPLPRVHLAHLHWSENADYAAARAPFILLGALDGWNISSQWSLSSLASSFGNSTVDFYPHNMDRVTVQPFMTSLTRALEEQARPTHAFPESETRPGAYIQWNVWRDDWLRLGAERMGSDELPAMFRGDEHSWLAPEPNEHCLHTKQLQDEFTHNTHWRMVLIGNRGAGMFIHQDVLRTASYQAQLSGSKRWYLCSPSESHLIGSAGGVDAFDPDYNAFPSFARARCFDDVVTPGEVIFYPADWWHQTENVRAPSVALSASMLHRDNHLRVIDVLEAECATRQYSWGFSRQLCDDLRQKCFPFWKRHFGNNEAREPRTTKEEL